MFVWVITIRMTPNEFTLVWRKYVVVEHDFKLSGWP